MIKLMDALFTQEVRRFKGNTVATEGFYFNPKTVQQPPPPYIIGGNTDAAIKRACRFGDGWDGVAKQLDKALELAKPEREIGKSYHPAKPPELTMGAQRPCNTIDHVKQPEDYGGQPALPS